VASVFLPPDSPELTPIERLWRALKDKLADCIATTRDELSEATGHMLQSYSQAALQSLTGYTYCVQAVGAALQGING
jgi:hypothetical protein